jgi:hypothetical protein
MANDRFQVEANSTMALSAFFPGCRDIEQSTGL